MKIRKFGGALVALALALGTLSVATTPAQARHHWGGWGGYDRDYTGWGYGYNRGFGSLGSFAAGAALGGLVGNSLGGYGDYGYYSPNLYSGYSRYVPSVYSGASVIPSSFYGMTGTTLSPTYVNNGVCGAEFNGCNVCP